MVEPQRHVLDGRGRDPEESVVSRSDAREVEPEEGIVAAGRLGQAVARIPSESDSDHRRDRGPLGRQQLAARLGGDAAYLVLAEPVEGVPAGEVPDGPRKPYVAAQRVDVVVLRPSVLVHPSVVEEIEPRCERTVEEPGIREADGRLLSRLAAAHAEEQLVALAEEVVLRQVQRAQGAVLGAVPAADRKHAGRLFRDVDVDDDLVLGGARDGLGLDLLEVVQVRQLLLRADQLLRREEVALGHRKLAAENLLLAPRVSSDVDALDEDLRAFRDIERDVDLSVRHIERDLGIDVGRGPADRAVDVPDLLHRILQLGARVDVARLELHAPAELLDRQHLVAVDVDAADPELRALDHDDPDRDAGAPPVDLRVDRLHARLDVAVVVVQRDDTLDILVQLLALDRPPQDVEFALPRQHDVLDLVRLQPLRALDDDRVDRHLAALDNAEGDADVPVGELGDVGRDARLEVALLLIELLQLFGRPRHLDGVVDRAELEIHLLLELGGVQALVAGEVDVPDEGALGHDEGQLHPALEVLDLRLDVVEESEGEDRAYVVGEAGRHEGASDLGGGPAEDDGLLDAPIALNREVLNDDRRRGRRLTERWGHGAADPEKGQGKKNCESRPPPRGHGSSAVQSWTCRSSVPPTRASARRSGSRGR